jgi:hypothetical protein
LFKWVAKITARTRIHSSNKHEIGRKGHVPLSATDAHNPVFEWLTQDFQQGVPEFRQFIEEKHTTVT